jgi:hypothetical protein
MKKNKKRKKLQDLSLNFRTFIYILIPRFVSRFSESIYSWCVKRWHLQCTYPRNIVLAVIIVWLHVLFRTVIFTRCKSVFRKRAGVQ